MRHVTHPMLNGNWQNLPPSSQCATCTMQALNCTAVHVCLTTASRHSGTELQATFHDLTPAGPLRGWLVLLWVIENLATPLPFLSNPIPLLVCCLAHAHFCISTLCGKFEAVYVSVLRFWVRQPAHNAPHPRDRHGLSTFTTCYR
jgi:hypothetical protein